MQLFQVSKTLYKKVLDNHNQFVQVTCHIFFDKSPLRRSVKDQYTDINPFLS